MSETVWTLEFGDCIECGTGLVSLHATQFGAEKAALVLMKEKELPWLGQPDYKDWQYTERSAEENTEIIRYWRTRRAHDIVIIRKFEVQRER